MVIKACSYKLFLMIKDFKLKVFLPLVHLLSSLPASFFSELVEAPLIIWLMTCSRSCDFLRWSDFVLRRRFFHFVKSWNKWWNIVSIFSVSTETSGVIMLGGVAKNYSYWMEPNRRFYLLTYNLPLSFTVLCDRATPVVIFLTPLARLIRTFTHGVHHRDVTQWFAPGSDKEKQRMEIKHWCRN